MATAGSRRAIRPQGRVSNLAPTPDTENGRGFSLTDVGRAPTTIGFWARRRVVCDPLARPELGWRS